MRLAEHERLLDLSANISEAEVIVSVFRSLKRLRETLVYDALTRLPLVLWIALCAATLASEMLADFRSADDLDVEVLLQLLTSAAAVCFLLLLIGALSLRVRPVARAEGMLPRLVAVGGAFSISALAFFPKVQNAPSVAGLSLVLMLLGYGLGCYAVLHLGRSLSLTAEARRLVTTGPYAIVRHPLYVAEAVASVGLLLQFLAPLPVLLWAVHITLQWCRMNYEEGVLSQAFPEYGEYAKRVARLLPRLY